MPHKRKKSSLRQAEAAKRGVDNAPKSADKQDLSVSKSLYRVLNAEKIRSDRKTKLQSREAAEPPRKKVKQTIQPRQHETLRSFNQRVEEEYRPQLAAAYKTSRQSEGREKKKRKRAAEVEEATAPAPAAAPEKELKDWASAPKRSRLNDVAVEPPALRRPAKKTEEVVASHRLPITLAQRAAIEDERRKAIERYREIKETAMQARQTTAEA